MTDSVTNNMRQKAKSGVRIIDPEEFQEMLRRIEDLQGMATSIQRLCHQVTDVDDFQPPLIQAFKKVGRSLVKVSGDLSATTQLLEAQAKRIEAAANDIVVLRKSMVIGVLLCNVTGTAALALYAWKAALL